MKTLSNKKIKPFFEIGIDFNDVIYVKNQLKIAHSNLYLIKSKFIKNSMLTITLLLVGFILYPFIISELNNPLVYYFVFLYFGYLLCFCSFLFFQFIEFRKNLKFKKLLLDVLLIHRKKQLFKHLTKFKFSIN